MYVFLFLLGLFAIGAPYYVAAEKAGRSGMRYLAVAWGVFLPTVLISWLPIVYLLLLINADYGPEGVFDKLFFNLCFGSMLTMLFGFGVLWVCLGRLRAGWGECK